MRSLFPDAEYLAFTPARVVKLKEGLFASTALFDGLRVEYVKLRLFLVIGCRALANANEVGIDED